MIQPIVLSLALLLGTSTYALSTSHPLTLSPPDSDSHLSQMALNGKGQGVIVYQCMEEQEGLENIQAVTLLPDGSWSKAETLYDFSLDLDEVILDLHCFINEKGSVVMTGEQENNKAEITVYGVERLPGAAWSSPLALTAAAEEIQCLWGNLDAQDRFFFIHDAVVNPKSLAFVSKQIGQGASQSIFFTPASLPYVSLAISTKPKGGSLVWATDEKGSLSRADIIDNLIFGGLKPTGVSMGNMAVRQAVVDDAGNVTIIGEKDNPRTNSEKLFAISCTGGVWSSLTNLSLPEEEVMWQTQLRLDAKGNICAVWSSRYEGGSDGVYAAFKPVGGKWLPTQALSHSGDIFSVQLACTPNGDFVAIWEQDESWKQCDIVGATFFAQSQSWGNVEQLSPSGVCELPILAVGDTGSFLAWNNHNTVEVSNLNLD